MIAPAAKPEPTQLLHSYESQTYMVSADRKKRQLVVAGL
jgi:hypothetical protein